MQRKNYCGRCGAFRVGREAMEEHLRTGHDPAEEGYNDGFAPGSYTPGSAIEEFGGEED